MARIRSIKPEFWDDRKLARSTSRDSRMLYMGLWNQADEHGRLNGDELWLKGRVFPYDDDVLPDDVVGMLDQLEDAGRIVRYLVDGDPFIYLPNLSKHQRLEPAKVESKHPAPPSDIRANESAPRADEPAQGDESSALLYVAGSMEHGTGSRGKGAARGTRLTEDWTPSDETRTWTLERLNHATASLELEKFRNYWIAKSTNATKVDWDRTWRNWVLNAAEKQGRASPQAASTADQRVDAGLALAAELRLDETRKELPA